MYIIILQGSYNEKTIKYDNYEDALESFNKHQAAGRNCYLTKVLMSSF
ncbi:hypothetical protein [Carnobacterium pleistocenium]|nr:hypothetical protein [Carnobacterium pleistocenium]